MLTGRGLASFDDDDEDDEQLQLAPHIEVNQVHPNVLEMDGCISEIDCIILTILNLASPIKNITNKLNFKYTLPSSS